MLSRRNDFYRMFPHALFRHGGQRVYYDPFQDERSFIADLEENSFVNMFWDFFYDSVVNYYGSNSLSYGTERFDDSETNFGMLNSKYY